MAKFEDGSYGSFPGIELIAKVLAGRCKMHYTRVAVGKGYIEEGQTPKTMTEPAGYVMDAKISGYTNPVAGECQVTVQINSADVENGFYATGLLLYAEDPTKARCPIPTSFSKTNRSGFAPRAASSESWRRLTSLRRSATSIPSRLLSTRRRLPRSSA